MTEEKIVKNTIRYCTSVDEQPAEEIARAVCEFCEKYKKIKDKYDLDSNISKIVTSIIYDLICYGKVRLWLLIGDRND